MQKVSELDYLKMSGWQKFSYRFVLFFTSFPFLFINFFKVRVPSWFKGLGLKFKEIGLTIGRAAKYGDWKTRLSFVVFGFSQLLRKQWLRGLLLLIFELMFILYMSLFGGLYLVQMQTLGTRDTYMATNEYGNDYQVPGDNSLLILLYGLLTVLFILVFVYVWYESIKSAYAAQEINEAGLHLATAKEAVASLLDEQYHKTLLGIPLAGLTIFTIIPIIFMIFVAFTNYGAAMMPNEKDHIPPMQRFQWIGWDNFANVFGGEMAAASKFGYTFAMLLMWTVIWAFFATFSNYVLGMIVAIIINKKGIKLKKLWRTVLVMTIAVPQFVSLLLISYMLNDFGAINNLLIGWGLITTPIKFLSGPTLAKITIIVVNVWVGIPYTMLITTGILMNIPEDLYESARIDGAGSVKAFFKITLPYMLHVTAPYLITQFIGNFNNFNVIYLLTGGGPTADGDFVTSAGHTDLLITWLYKMVIDDKYYGMASVISILMFVVTAVVSLIVYNRLGAVKNEEEFM